MKKAGDAVDRYRIEAVLGHGGMGEVYQAHDSRLARRVALKLLRSDSTEARQRMLREARAAAAFEHPNAIVVFDVGETDEGTFLAMELVRGRSLRNFVGDRAVPMARRLRWLVDVARALGAAHRAGLVHRDIKPDNVMIREDGSVKVLDFGIARRMPSAVDPSAATENLDDPIATLTAAGVMVGTPRYAPPEQLRGEPLDGRADQFAWGVTAYELLSGARPWTAPDMLALLAQMLSTEAEPLASRVPDAPPEVSAAVMRALEKRAADRFGTMEELAAALTPHAESIVVRMAESATSAKDGASIGAPPGEPTTRAPTSRAARSPPTRRMPTTLWAAAAVIAALVLVAGFAMHRLRPSPAAVDNRPLLVSSLSCAPATLDGESASAELARALGVGACARLAIELGVPWSDTAAEHTLRVGGRVAAELAEVELGLGGRMARGRGPSPLEAAIAAIAELRPALSAPPLSPEEIAAWGAKDEASARQIRRTILLIELRALPELERSVDRVIASDPESPWLYLWKRSVSGSLDAQKNREMALRLAEKLPPARAAAVRGAMLIQRSRTDRDEALRLLREAYAQAADDPDVASLHATALLRSGLRDEGMAVIDRLYTRHPTRSLVALRRVFDSFDDRNDARSQGAVERMAAVLPETAAWGGPLGHLVATGQIEAARNAVSFARRLGLGGPTAEKTYLDLTAAGIELAALEPAEARRAASVLLSDPRPFAVTSGADVTIASYWLEGRVAEAQSMSLAEMERHRTAKSSTLEVDYAYRDLQHRRLLGQPAPAAGRLDWIEKTVVASAETTPAEKAQVKAEVALARVRADPRSGKRVLSAFEAWLQSLDTRDAFEQASVRMTMVALVRAVRGDAAAASLWRENERAPYALRHHNALDAALAFEAIRDVSGAEQAYLLAMERWNLERTGFLRAAAHARLAALYRAEGRTEDAARLEAVVSRLWQRADAGLLETVRRMK